MMRTCAVVCFSLVIVNYARQETRNGTELADDTQLAYQTEASDTLAASDSPEVSTPPSSPVAQPPASPIQPVVREPSEVPIPTIPYGYNKIEFTQIGPSIELFRGMIQATPLDTLHPVHFTVVRVNMPTPGIALATEQLHGNTLMGFLEKNDARVVLSGGFLRSFTPPIPAGLVLANHLQLNRPARDELLNGALVISNGIAKIISFEPGDETLENWEYALQSGPLLVFEGVGVLGEFINRMLSKSEPQTQQDQRQLDYFVRDQAAQRAFIAIDRENRALLGITSNTTLGGLVQILIRPIEDNGFDCYSALNLTGDINSGMVILVEGMPLPLQEGDQYFRFHNVVIVP